MVQALSSEDLKTVATTNAITSPILASKVVGGRVELYLLGGPIVTCDLPAGKSLDLDQLDYSELYKLAQEYKIRGRTKMDEDELRVAIKKKL